MKQLFTSRFAAVAAGLFLLTGLLLGVAAHRVASRYESERARVLFEKYLDEQSATLALEMASISEVLYALGVLFESRESVTRLEFEDFTRPALARHPAIQALEWAPRVPARERRAHELQQSRDGPAGYRIRDQLPDGGRTPAPDRDEYYPVCFVAPRQSNEAAIGFDLGSDRRRKGALLRAMESGALTLTDPLVLVQEKDGSKGFLEVLPVYASPAASPEARRQNLKGWVVVAFRIEDVVRQTLHQRADGQSRMYFQLVDDGVDGEPVVVGSSADRPQGSAFEARSCQKRVALGGQELRLVAHPTPTFLAEHRSKQPVALGVGTALLWMTLGGLLLPLAKRSHDRALRRQDRIFRSVYHSLTEGVIVADDKARFLLFNEVAERVIGIGSANVPLEDWPAHYGCYLPDRVTLYQPQDLPLARAVRGEDVPETEMFIRNARVPDGVWISVRGGPLLDAKGKASGGVVAFRDVSIRKRAEEKLRASIKDLEDMKHALDQAAIVSTTDRNGIILYVNDNFCNLSGYSREELLGQDHRLLESGQHPEPFFRDMWAAIASGRVWRGEVRNRAKDGSHNWLDTTIVPFLDGRGEPVRYLSIRQDITSRKKSEESLQRLFNAVEQTGDSVFITDRHGIIEYVNAAFETTTGYTRQEALGKRPAILKSGTHDDAHYKNLWKTILDGDVYRATIVNRKKNGQLFYAEQTITPMKDGEGRVTHFVSVIKDMTEQRKRQEQEIEMDVATRIQRRLYPGEPPRIAGFDVAGAVYSANATCGDYFDYLDMPGGALGIAIGDVSGHGLGPALIMAETRAYLRSLAQTSLDLGEVLGGVNHHLASDLADRHYVTLLLARIDLDTRRLAYASAGHPPAYVLDRSGAVKMVLESTATALGLSAASKFEWLDVATLEPGDIVILLTDGLTDSQAPDGTYFDAEGVLEVVRAHRHEPARQIVESVQAAIRDFTGGQPQEDDITLVVCKLDPAL